MAKFQRTYSTDVNDRDLAVINLKQQIVLLAQPEFGGIDLLWVLIINMPVFSAKSILFSFSVYVIFTVIVDENAKLFRTQYYLYFNGLVCWQLGSNITEIDQVSYLVATFVRCFRC